MAADRLRWIELVDLDDPLLLPWLDLYETAFPANERVLVSSHLAVLKAQAAGAGTYEHLLAALDDDGGLAGMALVSIRPGEVAYLWYIAISRSRRGRGLGSSFYREIARRARADGCPAMVLEVEIPERAGEDSEREAAERRIGFYRRHGAKLLGGIHYLQSVGSHQPVTPMHIMVHAFRPLEAVEALALARGLFGGAVQAVGALTLD